MHQSRLIYLHGFASGPNSSKAKAIYQYYQQKGQTLIIPDFNQDDFQYLTLTRQLQQLESVIAQLQEPINLLGSSLGGLTAAIFAETHSQVSKLVLLAPAFNFLAHWLPTFSQEELNQWKSNRELLIYHYSKQKKLPLDYGFIEDLRQYNHHQLKRSIPTLIMHGIEDELIPLSASQDYARHRDWVKIVAMPSDHSLVNAVPQICQQLNQFL